MTLAAASPAGLRSEARFEGGAGADADMSVEAFRQGNHLYILEGVTSPAGAELNHPISFGVDSLKSVGANVMRNQTTEQKSKMMLPRIY